MLKNTAQEEVINTTEGQLIVVACPGSGKTTTLLRRINHMISDCAINPENILMITFTNAAAKEMRERYLKQYGNDPVTFSTIHSMCLAILKKFRGLTNDSILSDQQSYFYEVLMKHREINDKGDFVKMILTDISVLKNNRLDLKDFTQKCCDDKALFSDLYMGYEEYKRQYGLIDFDDMLLEAYDEMLNNPECLSWLRDRYRYIQVDEYQDTNFIQRDIVYLLAGEKGNLAVVGDDDQSIYGFRGARPEIMLNFQKHYPDAKMIKLSTNYRSDRGIIGAAALVISQNKERFPKEFLASSKDKGSVAILTRDSRASELTAVILQIKKLIAEGTDPSDIAVLYRTNRQSEMIASMLLAQQIPFVSPEKIPDRYQHWIFKDIQSYQRLAKGEGWTKQDLGRILNHPQRFLNGYQYIQAGLDQGAMRRYAFKSIKEEWKRNNALDNITDFFFGLKQLEGKKPSEFLKAMYGACEYSRYLSEYAKFRNEDLEYLQDIWKNYQKDAAAHDDWTEWGRYIIGYSKKLEEAQKSKKGVVLSTMHCSKGLEWKHVFIIDCVEEVTPFVKATTPEEIAEERRLFYVAMTRAKNELYLCTYKKKGSTKVKPSRFLPKKEI